MRVPDDALSKGETDILVDGLTDDVSFSWVLIHLGIRANPSPLDEAPQDEAIATAFAHIERLVSRGFVKVGRVEHLDPNAPQGTLAPVKHVEEPIDVVRTRVERTCREAKDWSDWAFSCWLVNTDAGDAVGRLAVETDA